MALTLLPTKLHRPRLGPQTVPRLRLLERLQADDGPRLTLLSAPAGFGKTTLAAAWAQRATALMGADGPDAVAGTLAAPPSFAPPPSAHAQRARPATPPALTAWLTLDAHDNDPIRFWAYVTASLQQARAIAPSAIAPSAAGQDWAFGLGLHDLAQALQGPRTPALDVVVESLLGALENALDRVLLILDDYQQIQTQAIHDSLHFFLSHLPDRVRVALLTRVDPPLPLNRWRAHGQLMELRARDLCFSAEEAGALLSRRARIVLQPQDVARLVQRTDGWPVGLQLAAASLQGRSQRDVERLVVDLADTSRYVLDYLMEEVLQSQPEPVRDFLLRTSILERMCAPLCDALLEARVEEGNGGADGSEGGEAGGETGGEASGEAVPDSRVLLNYLEENGLFVTPLEGRQQWQRYYHLFAEALRRELERSQPALGVALHRRAARWFAAHGFGAEAIGHALAAGDWEQAANDLASVAYTMMLRGDFTTLFGWLDRLPAAVISARPRLVLFRCYQLLFYGPLHEVADLIAQLDDAPALLIPEADDGQGPAGGPSLRGEVAALRAQLASFAWRVDETFALCDAALRWLPDEDHFSRAAVIHARGHAHLLAGQLGEAAEDFQAAVAAADELGSAYISLFPTLRQARAQALQGRLHLAEQTCRRALRIAQDRGGKEWPVQADAYLLLADLARERNDLLAADQYARQGMALAPRRGFEAYARACLVQARISQALGRKDASRAALAEAAQAALRYNNPLFSQWLGAHLARLDIASGDPEAARSWASHFAGHTEQDGYDPEFEEVTLARLSLAERRPRATLAALQAIESRAIRAGHLCCLVEIGVLTALCHVALNQRVQALEELQRALDLAEAEGFRRIFLDEGERLWPLLEALAEKSGYAAALLAQARHDAAAARRTHAADEPLDHLTPRELEILRALARGSSNQEIAELFVLTVGTVKGHVNHILDKLSARSRSEAVARARDLGLV